MCVCVRETRCVCRLCVNLCAGGCVSVSRSVRVQGTGPRKPDRTCPGDALVLAPSSSSHSPVSVSSQPDSTGRAHRCRQSAEAERGLSVV